MRTLRIDQPGELYERDLYAWALSQTAELRRVAGTLTNHRLDARNLAEEMAALARSERNAVRSYLVLIIEHLLKLDHSPATEPRFGWIRSTDNARAALLNVLTPTLRREIDRRLAPLFHQARRSVELSLREHAEIEAARALPQTCPYGLDDLLRDGWYSTVSLPPLD